MTDKQLIDQWLNNNKPTVIKSNSELEQHFGKAAQYTAKEIRQYQKNLTERIAIRETETGTDVESVFIHTRFDPCDMDNVLARDCWAIEG